MAGRLQVEVWHGTEISEADGAVQADIQPNITDGDQHERRLDCVVRTTLLFSSSGIFLGSHQCSVFFFVFFKITSHLVTQIVKVRF